MNGDAKRIHSGSDHRIYRFHFGWSTRGRSNHFNLTDHTPKNLRCASGEVLQRTLGDSFQADRSSKLSPLRQAESRRTRRHVTAVDRVGE